MKYLLICLPFFSIISVGCDTNKKKNQQYENKLLTWIKVQEEQINIELINAIAQDRLDNPLDTNWTEKGIVVTENDTTLLGELAKHIKAKSKCFYVTYLFTPVLSAPKTIRVSLEQGDSCGNVNPLKVHSDTTKYFIVENLPD